MKYRSGFTLIELLIVITLIGILIGVILIPGRALKDSLTERSALNSIVSLLRIARQQALAESNNIKIYFTAKNIVLKKQLISGEYIAFKTSIIPENLKLKQAVMVGFNSQGHPIQSRSIIFLNKKGLERRIAVAVGTGRITLY